MHSTQPSFLKVNLVLDQPKRMLSSCSDIRCGSIVQIIRSTLRHVWQPSKLPSLHGNEEADPPALHLVSLLDSLVVGILVDEGLFTVQEIRGLGEILPMGSRDFH